MLLSDRMKIIICLQLPPQDLAYVADCRHMCDVWESLCDKYMPSLKTELQAVKRQFVLVQWPDGNDTLLG